MIKIHTVSQRRFAKYRTMIAEKQWSDMEVVLRQHGDSKAADAVFLDEGLKPWILGTAQTKDFVSYGYNRLRNGCPYRFGLKCKAEKCQFYVLKNMVGDCAIRWNAIINTEQFFKQSSI